MQLRGQRHADGVSNSSLSACAASGLSSGGRVSGSPVGRYGVAVQNACWKQLRHKASLVKTTQQQVLPRANGSQVHFPPVDTLQGAQRRNFQGRLIATVGFCGWPAPAHTANTCRFLPIRTCTPPNRFVCVFNPPGAMQPQPELEPNQLLSGAHWQKSGPRDGAWSYALGCAPVAKGAAVLNPLWSIQLPNTEAYSNAWLTCAFQLPQPHVSTLSPSAPRPLLQTRLHSAVLHPPPAHCSTSPPHTQTLGAPTYILP